MDGIGNGMEMGVMFAGMGWEREKRHVNGTGMGMYSVSQKKVAHPKTFCGIISPGESV